MIHTKRVTLARMVSSEDPQIQEMLGLTDPLARARRCEEYLGRWRAMLAEAQRLRDASIREARSPGSTIDGIAAAVGVKRNIVVNALRGGVT